MEIACIHCRKVIEYQREPPRFCSHCGKPLEAAGPDVSTLDQEAQTAAYQPRAVGARPAREFGDYQLLGALGRGGMGVVYEAEHRPTGRRVALKLLPFSAADSSLAVERFMREGKLAAAISHPRSTFIYSAGEIDGQLYIAMELMPGGTLKDVFDREGPLPLSRAVDYVLDVLDGLEAAHAAGVVHRDVKPSNCFLDDRGRVKVGDYGLSKSLTGEVELTHTGAFLGTPLFAAPEQVKGQGIEPRTDIYAVGATLFFLLTGRGPFTGDAAQVIAKIASEAPPPLRGLRPDVPKDLERVVARTLEKDPARRFTNIDQLRRALTPFATQGASIADLGRRMAAFFVDLFIAWTAVSLASTPYHWGSDAGTTDSSIPAVVLWLSLCFTVGYFAVLEGWWGCGPGKWLLGLRVVGSQGMPPGLLRGTLRAAILPGVSELIWVLGSLALRDTDHLANNVSYGLLLSMFADAAILAAGWGGSLVCLISMRRSNGYRGIHELISRTRVVSLRRARAAWRGTSLPVTVPVITPTASAGPAGETSTAAFGPYAGVGVLGSCGKATVWQGSDRTLDRGAWIHVQPGEQANFTAERLQVSRPTRPRWLQGGMAQERRWDAFEATYGAPLTEVLSDAQRLSWEEGRLALMDLASELRAALADGSLPATLSLEQLWVDQNGRLKMLDEPLIAAPDGSSRVAASQRSATREPGDQFHFPSRERANGAEVHHAWALFQEAAARCGQEPALPGYAHDFVANAVRQPATAEAFTWAVDQLEEMAERRARLDWDYRLGVLSISMYAEAVPYFLLAGALALAAFQAASYLVELAPEYWSRVIYFVGVQTGIALPLALVAPAVAGFALRGGLAFRLAGVQVQRANGCIASRWRCAWRSVVSWAPVMAGSTLFESFVVNYEALALDAAAEQPVGFEWPFLVLFVLGVMLLGYAVIGAGYAVLRPSRGLQDWIAGTRLVPR